MTTVNIPSSVNSIGTRCFESCGNLTQINIKKASGTIEGAPWGAVIGNRAVKWEE